MYPPLFPHPLCALGGDLYELHDLGTGASWLPDGFSQWEDMTEWRGESYLPFTVHTVRDCTVLGEDTVSV